MTGSLGIGLPGCRFVERTTSTQDEARRWAQQGAPDGAVVIADEQIQGRGRLQRSWHSPPGKDLYLSRVVKGTTDELPFTPLMGALAVDRAVASFLPAGARVGIKWPNDIWIDGQKVAGILCEVLLSPESLVLLGIGVNLNMGLADFPADLRAPATSLGIVCGHPVDRRRFLETLLGELDAWQPWLSRSPGQLLAAYRERCLTLGQCVLVSTPGQPPIRGRAVRIADDGALLIEEACGGVRQVEAGDVDLCRHETR